jgi:hypothetical protein
VLIVDESGDLKKGEHTVGVQRQHTGTAGRIENAQVAVYLAYASRTGHALIDRELYLPRSWATDPDRRTAAGVPDKVEFATKPALATAMIARGVEAGLPVGWVTADEVYGIDPDLRTQLETLRLGYVLGIGCNRRVTVHGARGGVRMRADQVAAGLASHCWTRCLVDGLGCCADPVADIGGLECVQDFEQGRLVQGHRVAPLWVFLGGFTQRLTRWPLLRAQARRRGPGLTPPPGT